MAFWSAHGVDSHALVPRISIVIVLLLAAFGDYGFSHWVVLCIYGGSTMLPIIASWMQLDLGRLFLPALTIVIDAIITVYIIGDHLALNMSDRRTTTDAIGMLPAFLFLLQTGFHLRRKFVALFSGLVAFGWGGTILLLSGGRFLPATIGAAAITGDILNLIAFLAASTLVLNGVGWINRAVSAALRAQNERLLFSRFLPNAVARDLVRGGSVSAITERHACLLSIDLRGSSKLAREHSSSDSITWLLEFRNMVHENILKEHGVVDKYIGDGVLVVFLQGSENEQATHALKASRNIFNCLDWWNAQREAQQIPVLDIVISAHCGRVLAGVFDDGYRPEFTVLGPAVNELSRIEKCAKQAGVNMLASQSFIDLVSFEERPQTAHDWVPLSLNEEGFTLRLAIIGIDRVHHQLSV